MDRKGEIHNNTASCWYEWCFPWNLNVLGINVRRLWVWLKPSVLAGFWVHSRREGKDCLFIAKCGWNCRFFISYCWYGCAVGPQFFVWCTAEVEWLLSERAFFCFSVFLFFGFLLIFPFSCSLTQKSQICWVLFCLFWRGVGLHLLVFPGCQLLQLQAWNLWGKK